MIFLDQHIMFVQSYSLIIMQNWEDKNFLIELVLTQHQSIQLDDCIYSNDDAISVLLICDVESFVTALHLWCQKWEIHLICNHQIRCSFSIINRELQFIKLLSDECRWFKIYSRIKLQMRIFDKKDKFDSAFIDSFN